MASLHTRPTFGPLIKGPRYWYLLQYTIIYCCVVGCSDEMTDGSALPIVKLTHWSRDKMAAISQTISSLESNDWHFQMWFPELELIFYDSQGDPIGTDWQHVIYWYGSAPSHYLNQCWRNYLSLLLLFFFIDVLVFLCNKICVSKYVYISIVYRLSH